MTTDMISTLISRGARTLAGALGVSLAFVAAPASASPPASWDDTHASALHLLLLIVGIPVAAALLITLLVYLPSMVRGGSREPAVAFQEHPEWFGGPSGGSEAVAAPVGAGQAETAVDSDEPTTGGAGARW